MAIMTELKDKLFHSTLLSTVCQDNIALDVLVPAIATEFFDFLSLFISMIVEESSCETFIESLKTKCHEFAKLVPFVQAAIVHALKVIAIIHISAFK